MKFGSEIVNCKIHRNELFGDGGATSIKTEQNRLLYRITFHDFMILMQKKKEEEGELTSEDTMIINERILDIEEEFKN